MVGPAPRPSFVPSSSVSAAEFYLRTGTWEATEAAQFLRHFKPGDTLALTPLSKGAGISLETRPSVRYDPNLCRGARFTLA